VVIYYSVGRVGKFSWEGRDTGPKAPCKTESSRSGEEHLITYTYRPALGYQLRRKWLSARQLWSAYFGTKFAARMKSMNARNLLGVWARFA
jgi:hypothetical protein